MSNKGDIVIIGGGITGLSAAWRLAKQGFAVQIFERSQFSGGIGRSIEHEGFILDHGIHGLYSARQETQEIVNEILREFGQDFLCVAKKTSIYFQKQYLKYPLGPVELFKALPITLSVQCIFDFLLTRLRKRIKGVRAGDSFEEWVSERFGSRLYNIYFGPYVEKVWGLPGKRMSSAWLARRVSEISLIDVIKEGIVRVFRRSSFQNKMRSLQPPTFWYPCKGSGQLVDRIRSAAEEAGARIFFNVEVRNINIQDGRVVSLEVERNGVAETLQPDHVISSVPLPTLIRLLGDQVDQQTINAARSLRYRSMVIVNLFINRANVYKDQWVYYSDSDLIFNRVNEFTNLGEGFSPPGKTALNCEITCFRDDETWNSSDEDLVGRCLDDLAKLGVLKRGDVFDSSVVRLVNAYPGFEVGVEGKVERLLRCVEDIDNLYTLGRQGRFEYINMDECIWHATTCAEEIIKKSHA